MGKFSHMVCSVKYEVWGSYYDQEREYRRRENIWSIMDREARHT
jgi:hypothetical protein